MNYRSIIFFLLLASSSLHSSEWTAEIRGGYFYPTSGTFQKIYKHGGGEGEIEVTRTVWDNWIGFANVNYFQRDGHSLGIKEKTTIRMVPISLGVKYPFCLCDCISPYLGAGITYTVLNIKNDSDFVKRHVVKGGVGFVVKSGATIDLTETILLDLFVDYYYQRIHFYQKSEANVGGLRMGIGLGYRF